jgi:hypothetical protein
VNIDDIELGIGLLERAYHGHSIHIKRFKKIQFQNFPGGLGLHNWTRRSTGTPGNEARTQHPALFLPI